MRTAKLVVAATPTSVQELLGTDEKMRNGTFVIIQASGGPVNIGTAAQQPYVLAAGNDLHVEGTGLKNLYIQGTAAILVVR